MRTSFAKQAVVLGLLSAMGPFAIDMYLPALPSLAQNLHATPAAAQQSLMAFFFSVGVCQVLYGPLADMFGRKRPLYVGLLLFALTSVACAFVTNIEELIVWRFVQGVGACAAMVIPRAIVRDLYTGAQATRMMSLLMLVFSVSPLLAPLSGSVVIAWHGWRGVFWAVSVLATLGLVLTWRGLPETRPPSERLHSTLGQAFRNYLGLLRDARFLGLCLMSGFGMSAFFVYLANSSFVLIEHFGLTPTQYSFFFSINAVAFIGTAQLTGWLTTRYGLTRVVRNAALCHVLSIALLCVLWRLGFHSLGLLAALLFIGFGFLGLIIPVTTVLALDDHGAIAGTASALLGTLQMVTGALVVSVLGTWADGTPWPMVASITISATLTFVVTWYTLARRASEVGGLQAEPAPD